METTERDRPVNIKPGSRRRVLFVSHDIVDARMAGPGIRALELARVLSRDCDVTLAVPNAFPSENHENPGLTFHTYRYADWPSIAPAFAAADLVILDSFTLNAFPQIPDLGIPIVADLYDPFPLESLYVYAHTEIGHQSAAHYHALQTANRLCSTGDYFICANSRQRDWWLGLLQANGRINPLTVADDPTLRRLIEEVPFGLPSRPFPDSCPGVKERLPFISPDDRLILWGGGIWQWLDPLTLVRAMPAIVAEEPRARLLFPGTRHPNKVVPAMPIRERALELARELGLLDRYVFFGEWVAYEEWPAYLADADVAVSLHFDTPETRFAAVRSRILSYIWAGLPMVVTTGDVASELIAGHDLGLVVGYEDVAGTSRAVLKLLAGGKQRYRPNFERIASELTWDRVARPLLDFCRAPRPAPDKGRLTLGPCPDLEAHRRWQDERIEQLERTIEAYERGRFISMMRRIQTVRRRLRNER